MTASTGMAPHAVLTPTSSAWYNTGNNRITSFAYDLSGNLTGANSVTYAYDAENRLTQATTNGLTINYAYDGEGRRVQKTAGTTTNTYVYDAMGQLAAEYDGTSPAAYDTRYLFADHLGSTRVVSDANGTVRTRHDYLPFGEEIGASVGNRVNVPEYAGTDSITQKFTGKERDTDIPGTPLDYFGARYFSSNMGRFTTPDRSAKPEPVPYADFSDRQTLNLYAYVRNNPLTRPDADGHSDYLWQRVKNAVLGRGYKTDAQVQGWSVAQTARSHEGSTDWAIDGTNTSGKDVGHPQAFTPGRNKCNEFVGDTLAEAGRPRPEITDKDGNTRMPNAHELADPNVHIPGLSDPRPLSEARPGDVIAQQHGDTWGHAGIVVGKGRTASANANEGGKITVNDWGFRPAGQNGESSKDPAPVVRHPEEVK